MNPEVMNQMIRDKARLVEMCVVGSIEAVEDMMPADEEVIWFLQRVLSERREEYLWKDRLIVRVDYWPAPGVPYKIFSLVNPLEPVPL